MSTPFLVVDAAGSVMERGRLSLDAHQTLNPMRTVAIAPGTDVLVRRLDLTPGSAAQQRAAALWTLKDDLAARPERLTVALGQVAQSGHARWAAVVDTALLEAWREHLSALGAPADVILPDSLIAPEPDLDGEVSLMTLGAHALIRTTDAAMTVQADLAPLLVGDRPATAIDSDDAIQALMIRAALHPPLDLLEARRRDASARRGWLRAAILAGLLLASPLVLIGAAGLRDSLAADRTEAQARAAVIRAAPDLAESDDPVADMLEQLKTAPPSGGALNALAALSSAIEGVPGAAIENLSLAPDMGLRVGLAYPAFQDLQTLKQAMAPAGLALTELSTVEDEGRVVSDLVVEAAR